MLVSFKVCDGLSCSARSGLPAVEQKTDPTAIVVKDVKGGVF